MRPELVIMIVGSGRGFLILIRTCFRLWECGAVLAGVKAKPCGWPAASLDPSCGRRGLAVAGSRSGVQDQQIWGGDWWRDLSGLELGGRVQRIGQFFLILLRKWLAIEHIFEYNTYMQLGDPTAG